MIPRPTLLIAVLCALASKPISSTDGTSVKMEAGIDAATGEPLDAEEYVYP